MPAFLACVDTSWCGLTIAIYCALWWTHDGHMMGAGQPYPIMPQITVGPAEFLSVNGMVTPDVPFDDAECKGVLSQSSLHALI